MRGLATTWSTPRLYWLVVMGIMLVAIFLRLWRLDLVQFRDDQGALMRLAEDMVRLGRVPLAGMTDSLGTPLPPQFEYVLAPIVVLSRDPQLATAAIGLANVAAVGGTLLLGWRWFSPLAGLVVGLAYATNPWAVFFSRKIWSNDVLAPMAVVLMFCLDNAIVGEQVGWGVAAFPVFALGAEFHPSFVLLAPIMVVLAAVMLRRGRLKHLATGLGLAVVTALPYVLWEVQTQWSYLRVLGTGDAQPTRIDADGPGDVIGLIGGWHNWNVEGLDINVLLPWHVAAVPGTIETLLLAIGIAGALVLVFAPRRFDRPLRLRAGGLLLWVVPPMLLTLRHSIPLYDRYFLFVLPAGALLIGLGLHVLGNLALLQRNRRMLVVGALLAGVIGMAVMQGVIIMRGLAYLTEGYVVTYGPPLAAAEQTTRELIDLVNNSGGRQLSIEVDDVNDAAIGYLARPYVPEVQVVARRRGPWDVNFDLPNQPGGPSYQVSGPPQLTAPESLDVAYADGVKVLSAATTKVATPGESVGLALTWTMDHHSPDPLTNRLVWEMSLYDPSGREVRRVAGVAHDWTQLEDGEVVVTWMTVATAPQATEGVYQVHVNRLHPVSRNPVPSAGAGAEWSSGRVELRRR